MLGRGALVSFNSIILIPWNLENDMKPDVKNCDLTSWPYVLCDYIIIVFTLCVRIDTKTRSQKTFRGIVQF